MLVGERLTSPDGTLSFYCEPDWTPLSGTRFGTQLQTAHRLVTAGEQLGASNDGIPARLFRRAIELGWDRRSGGFFFADYGYRPQRQEWWGPAECLRALAVLGPLAGGDGDRRALEERVWSYLARRVLDEQYGGMYTESIDGLPFRRRALGIRFAPDSAVAKGSIWKDGWHEGKALLVCMAAAQGDAIGV